MAIIGDTIGRIAGFFESSPRIWRVAAKSYSVLRRNLQKIGIGLPRHTPSGLRKLRRLLIKTGTQPVAETAAPRILILSPRGWATHLFLDTLFAKALELRGAKIVIWSCGNPMPICHILNSNDGPPMPCTGCIKAQNSILDTGSFERVTTAETIAPGAIETLRREIADLSRSEILRRETEGVELGEIARIASNWFCRTAEIPDTPEALQFLRDFLLLGETTLKASQVILEQVKPDLVFMLNGVFTEESVFRTLCEKDGIPYICYERAFGFNHLLFSRNQLANHSNLSQHWDSLRNEALTAAQDSELDSFLLRWKKGEGTIVRYWTNPEERDEVIRSSLGIDPGIRILTLFTNVVWDTAAFGRDVAFDSMWDWISHTIEMVGNDSGLHLVVRIHPAEVKVEGRVSEDRILDRINQEFKVLPENVSIIAPEEEISSYRLVALSDVTLVYTSTIGLEAAIIGKFVVVAGETHYRNKGFTFDPVDREEYNSLLTNPLNGDSAVISTQARRYGHLFFLKYMYPIPFFEEVRMGSPRLNIDSLDELQTGSNRDLDNLCRFILDTAGNSTKATLLVGE